MKMEDTKIPGEEGGKKGEEKGEEKKVGDKVKANKLNNYVKVTPVSMNGVRHPTPG